jgi:cobalt-zinc-cadmium efflux system protein
MAFSWSISDAAVSAGVVAAGAITIFTAWNWIDPMVSLGVSVVIVWAGGGKLKDATNLSPNAVPSGIDPEAVRNFS